MTYLLFICRCAFILLVAVLPAMQANGQSTAISFQKLTVKQGLNDGMVNAMAQDEDSYMWFASLGGLNRFDGKNVRRFTHRAADTNSLRNSIPYTLASHGAHTLWVGFIDGLQRFDTYAGRAQIIHHFDGMNIRDIIGLPGNRLLVLSKRAMYCYHILQNKIVPLLANASSQADPLLAKPVYSAYLHNNQLLLGSDDGVISIQLQTGSAYWYALPPATGAVSQLGIDATGSIWALVSSKNQLWRIRENMAWLVDWLLKQPGETRLAEIQVLTAAGKNDIWIGTRERGLIGYNIISEKASYYRHQPDEPSSLSADIIRTMYQSSSGMVWINTMHGIDYFQPGQSLFRQFDPYASNADPELARGVSEDHTGKLWLTSLRGISCYDPQTGNYKTWRNEAGKPEVLYNNSVRATAEDEQGRIWIATAGGINRLSVATGHMEFLTEKDGLPKGFYFAINKDRQGRLWFASRDNGYFYFYNPADKKIHSIYEKPELAPLTNRGGRCVYQDSKGRLWFGYNAFGLGMYDSVTRRAHIWHYNEQQSDSSLANDLVIDIKEDNNAVIWVTSFGGLNGIDIAHNRRYEFTDKTGLKSNIAGPLAVDAANRLWVGTSAGLLVIDSARKTMRYLTEEDGLPVVEMPEHTALSARNGDIIMPTIHGFIRFDPQAYAEQKRNIPCFLSAIALLNSADTIAVAGLTNKTVELQPQDNFFTIGLEAINFQNPSQTWYAYKLEGFDKDWRYTQDPKAVYTNVPGGKYKFLYKASANAYSWSNNAKALNIVVQTIFYKTVWFWTLLLVLIVALWYAWYKRKIERQRQWLQLENKAQALEKEKTLVMYESLKQQLSPHFLFNSLTSLAGLIETDQGLAGRFLAGMSRIYRYILQSSDNELVSIKDDLAMMQVYVRLQQTRFDKGLEVIAAVQPDDLNKKIAPVTLQNLVENAIKHNIIDEDAPLVVRITSDGEYLMVSNNLQKKRVVETSNKRGLSSLEALYRYLSEKPLIIEENTSAFTIWLPLIS